MVEFLLLSINDAYCFEIEKDFLTIGRDHFMCEYLCKKPFVSRKHAIITTDGKSLVIENLSEKNSTYVNNKRLAVGERVSLTDGDELGLGGFTEHGKRQEDAAYFLVRIGESIKYKEVKEKIVLSDNITTLQDARELLVRHHSFKVAFREDIHDLITLLDTYTHLSEAAEEVIKRIFPPPQMAFDKFMGELSDSDLAFFKLICKAADLIGITVSRSAKRDEILRKIKEDSETLASLCEDLTTALISIRGDDDDEATKDIEVLLTDLQSLIESVKNYS